MVISKGSVVWVDYGQPRGSEPAKRRPAIAYQNDWLTQSNYNTILTIPLTSNVARARFPGNVLVRAGTAGLPRDSVAVASHLGPVDRQFIDPIPVGTIPYDTLLEISAAVSTVLGNP